MHSYNVSQLMHSRHEIIGRKVERPYGKEEFVFVHFVSPVDITIEGHTFRTMPDACILFTPKHPQFYEAVSNELLNNYILFTLNDDNCPDLQKIPKNIIFYTSNGDFLNRIFEDMQWHFSITKDPEKLSELMKRMFMRLSFELNSSKKANYPIFDRFEQLHNEIYRQPSLWSVQKMADYVSLSRAYFSTKYKEKFGISPNEDLKIATIVYAERLLITTNLNIVDISIKCGYDSESHFIKIFKNAKGFSPAKFRKLNKDQSYIAN